MDFELGPFRRIGLVVDVGNGQRLLSCLSCQVKDVVLNGLRPPQGATTSVSPESGPFTSTRSV